MSVLRSRDNPRLKRWARLARDAAFRKKEKRTLLEGPHLVEEALAAGLQTVAVFASESAAARPEIRKLATVVVSDSLFRLIADADSPQGVAAEIAIPAPQRAARGPVVFLEGVQDPGNVGAIVRSAAAFGASEVVLDRGCADPWSPKALRAGMGGHFRLSVRPAGSLASELGAFQGTIVCTLAHGGRPLRTVELPGRLGWVFGAEGRGVSEGLARRAALKVTIPMQAGVESLNVAASAAVCLYEAFSRPAAGS
jgi:RNA methyltransferase, TrmH family